MSAYLIGRVTVRDPSYIAEYQSKTEPLIQRHDGQILVGAMGGTDSMAILEGGGTVRSAQVGRQNTTKSRARGG